MKGKESGFILAGLLIIAILFGGYLMLTGSREGNDGEFNLSHLKFCSKEPRGYMNYTEQPENTYSVGETIWIYFNVNNHEYNLHSDGSFELWLVSDVALEGPNGSNIPVSDSPMVIHENVSAARDPEKVYIQHRLTLSGENISLGQYAVEITVSDKLSNGTARISGNFILA